MQMNQQTSWPDDWPFARCFVCTLSFSIIVEKKKKKKKRNVETSESLYIYSHPTIVGRCLIWTTCSYMYISLSPDFWPNIDLFLFLSFSKLYFCSILANYIFTPSLHVLFNDRNMSIVSRSTLMDFFFFLYSS
jgi:hypothetical protein